MVRVRQAIYGNSRPACKCHGVSGSCSTRTCWNQLAAFREVGTRLKRRYDGARRVRFNSHGTALQPVDKQKQQRRNNDAANNGQRRRGRRPTKDDLVYLDASPDYCEPDSRAGSSGTRGRRCGRGSAASDGCGQLCCGRGYNSQTRRTAERCHCRFHWCCHVLCKTCLRTENVDTCK